MFEMSQLGSIFLQKLGGEVCKHQDPVDNNLTK